MRFPRSSGILLHPSSLPGRFGIGDLGPRGPRVRQFPGRDGSAVVASLAAGANGLQEFALSVALIVRGKSSTHQSRGAGRAGLAERAGDSRPLGLAGRRGRFPAGFKPQRKPASPRLRELSPRRCGIPGISHERARAGWKITASTWRSRKNRAACPGLSGSPTWWLATPRRWRGGGTSWPRAFVSTSSFSTSSTCQLKALRKLCAEKSVGLIGDIPDLRRA